MVEKPLVLNTIHPSIIYAAIKNVKNIWDAIKNTSWDAIEPEGKRGLWIIYDLENLLKWLTQHGVCDIDWNWLNDYSVWVFVLCGFLVCSTTWFLFSSCYSLIVLTHILPVSPCVYTVSHCVFSVLCQVLTLHGCIVWWAYFCFLVSVFLLCYIISYTAFWSSAPYFMRSHCCTCESQFF